jgi:tRNA pseudouridine13 synthase|tara:strand:- start:5198 stop:6385 length:1188 start_codon:yes stop_codon:yes gene_type:complete
MIESEQQQKLSETIKNRPEDFVVDELPLYEPCGEGEHVYLCVRKTGITHDLMVRLIAKEFGVKPRAIGTAGRKDRNAVTTQLVSIHTPGEANREVSFSHDGLDLLWQDRHTNKLRFGHLLGNRFDIRIRDIDPIKVTTLQKRLEVISIMGLPNAFGVQRFGNDANNHLFGAALITNKFDELLFLILSGNERHHQFANEGEWKKALDAWPLGNPVQQHVLEALVCGKTSQDACKRISKTMQKLWINALQSHIFNRTLSRRQIDGTWDTLLLGDLAWQHDGGGRTFEVSEEDDLQERAKQIEISPTGPLWGPKMRMPSGDVLKVELEDLVEYGVRDELQQNDKLLAAGARRPLRVPVKNTSIGSGVDEHGGFVRVQFELPAGSYATVLIDNLLTASL